MKYIVKTSQIHCALRTSWENMKKREKIRCPYHPAVSVLFFLNFDVTSVFSEANAVAQCTLITCKMKQLVFQVFAIVKFNVALKWERGHPV